MLAYEVSLEKGEAVVSYDPARTTPARIAESVTQTGYTASVRGLSSTAPAPVKTSATTAGAADRGTLERVTLFRVPLMCPAVKGLGGGGKARPFMSELEKQPEIAEAWLNHPGTLLGVVGREPQAHAHASSLVASLCQAKGLSVTALEGAPLGEALQDFAARAQWYRGEGGRDTKVLLGLAAKYMDEAQLKVYGDALEEGFQALSGASPS